MQTMKYAWSSSAKWTAKSACTRNLTITPSHMESTAPTVHGKCDMHIDSSFLILINSFLFHSTPPPSSSKPKVYSILEKARYVMDDPNYGIVKAHRCVQNSCQTYACLYIQMIFNFIRSRDHELYDHHGEYDRYATPPPPQSSKHSSHHAQYDSSSYERDYRREYHPHSSSSSYAAAYTGKSHKRSR